MGAPVTWRLGIAVSVALVSVGSTAPLTGPPAARAGGEQILAPDLVTLPVTAGDLVVERRGGRILLRFTNEVANVGAGPLEIAPSAVSENCDGDGDPGNDRTASQRLYTDADADGAFTAGVDGIGPERRFGCLRYHPAHDHWHVLEFAAYELRREPRAGIPGSGGRLVAGSRKVGFCVTDNRRAFPGPYSAPGAVYPVNPGGSTGCDSGSTQGTSVGWADAYVASLPGQQLEITQLTRGHYCLLSTVDPSNILTEVDDSNNLRNARISMRPRKLTVRRLSGRCRA